MWFATYYKLFFILFKTKLVFCGNFVAKWSNEVHRMDQVCLGVDLSASSNAINSLLKPNLDGNVLNNYFKKRPRVSSFITLPKCGLDFIQIITIYSNQFRNICRWTFLPRVHHEFHVGDYLTYICTRWPKKNRIIIISL